MPFSDRRGLGKQQICVEFIVRRTFIRRRLNAAVTLTSARNGISENAAVTSITSTARYNRKFADCVPASTTQRNETAPNHVTTGQGNSLKKNGWTSINLRRPMPPPRARCELANDVSARRPMQTGSTNAVSRRDFVASSGCDRRH